MDGPRAAQTVKAHVLVFPGDDQQPGSGLFRGVAAGLRGSHREFLQFQNGSPMQTSFHQTLPGH